MHQTHLTPQEEANIKMIICLVLPILFIILSYLAGAFINLSWIPTEGMRTFMVFSGLAGFVSAIVLCL